MLGEAFRLLSEEFDLDYLILDTSAGMSNETLVALAGSRTVLTLVRSDRVDLNTARLNADLVQTLSRGQLMLVLSGVGPTGLDLEFEKAYRLPVTAALPAVAEVAEVSGQTLFVETFPEHQLTTRYQEIADALAAAA
ncbi:MAG TPA: hypothetical protein VFN97_04895 [Actinospica sp.]|nr:hypothetical protein [Actinospica sp.]